MAERTWRGKIKTVEHTVMEGKGSGGHWVKGRSLTKRDRKRHEGECR